MKIFMAGNFPLMKSKEDEKKMRDKILSSGNQYRRLISFYYKKDIKNLLDLRKEELDANKC